MRDISQGVRIRTPRCRDCADSDGFCRNDPRGPNCGFHEGHPLHRWERFRPRPASTTDKGERADEH